jgi:hypothetical protein
MTDPLTEIRDKITALIAYIILQVQAFITRDTVAGYIQDKLWGTATQQQLDNFFNNLPTSLQTNPDIANAYTAARAAKPATWDDFVKTAAGLVDMSKDALQKTYMKIEPVAVNNAFDRALSFVAFDIGKDVSIGLAGLTTEVVSVGQVDTFTDFWKFVAGKTGYGGVTTMLMKAPIEMTVMRPLSYWLHQQFRNELPEGKELVYAYWKGLLDTPATLSAFNSDPLMAGYSVSSGRELIDRVLSFSGMPSWWTDIHIEGMYKALNPRQLGDVLQDSAVDDTWLEKHIRAYGVDPVDVPVFLQAIKGRFYMPFQKAVASEIGSMYKDGYIDLATYNSEMTALGIPPQVIEYDRQIAKMKFDIELNKDLKAEWIAQYLHDIISEDELRLDLSDIIVSPRMVDAVVGLAKARKKIARGTTTAGLKQGVRISSKPSWISVFVDGVDVQRLTRATILLQPGPHTIELRSPDYYPTSHSVTIQSGEFIDLHDVLKAVPTLFAISVSPTAASVTVGGTGSLSVSGVDQYGDPYPLTSPVTWTSMDPAIANVDGSGNVKGISSGKTYIQAKSGAAFGQATVTVS